MRMAFDGMKRAAKFICEPINSALTHRHLLKEFAQKEIRGQFAGSMGGALWALLNPLAMVAVYLYVFSIVFRVQVTVAETGTDSFAIYFFCGLFPWLMFTDALTRAVGCVVDHASLIKKVIFPVEVLLAGTVLASFIVNGTVLLLLIGFLGIIGYTHTSWLLVLILLPLQLLMTSGAAFFLAAACVFLRDTKEFLRIILMLWFFSTPILYPLSMVPNKLKPFLSLNPMAILVCQFRDALLTHRVDWSSLASLCLFSMVFYGIGVWFFMRAKPAFGDVL